MEKGRCHAKCIVHHKHRSLTSMEKQRSVVRVWVLELDHLGSDPSSAVYCVAWGKLLLFFFYLSGPQISCLWK